MQIRSSLLNVILGSLAGGMSVDEVAEEYGIKRDDVLAAIEYAAKLISTEEIKSILDAYMPRSSTKLIRSSGYDIEDVRDIGLRSSKDKEIVKYALKKRLQTDSKTRGR